VEKSTIKKAKKDHRSQINSNIKEEHSKFKHGGNDWTTMTKSEIIDKCKSTFCDHL
jgi:hypothetical protein